MTRSDKWQDWVAKIAPVVKARRRLFAILRDNEAVQIVFDVVAPKMVGRKGGYTRILRLAKPRLGDAGTRAILELVGRHDRKRKVASQKPEFAADEQFDDLSNHQFQPLKESQQTRLLFSSLAFSQGWVASGQSPDSSLPNVNLPIPSGTKHCAEGEQGKQKSSARPALFPIFLAAKNTNSTKGKAPASFAFFVNFRG